MIDIGQLYRISKTSRATLAALRAERGRPTLSPRGAAVLAPLLLPGADAALAGRVAVLYALHPRHAEGADPAEALRALAEPHKAALLAAAGGTALALLLERHLPRTRAALDFYRLYDDLQAWPEEAVRRRWALKMYATRKG